MNFSRQSNLQDILGIVVLILWWRRQDYVTSYPFARRNRVVFENVPLKSSQVAGARLFDGGRGFIVYLKRVSLMADGSAVWLDKQEGKAEGRSANPIEEEVRRYHRAYLVPS
jgi:hypothetical protein